MIETIKKELDMHIQTATSIKQIFSEIEAASLLAIETVKKNGKLLLFGNGGSAADAQHISAELVGRFKKDRRGLPSIALTTDTSALTSIGNDFGYDLIFRRQLEALLSPHDMVIGISTSGNSSNVLNALNFAKENNVTTIGLTGGDGGKMSKVCDLNIVVPSNDTPRIQEMHIFIGHTICQIIEEHFSN